MPKITTTRTTTKTFLLPLLLLLNSSNAVPADNTMEIVGQSGVSAQQVSGFLYIKRVE